ncbi:hypothetical protein yrohd0001_28340 [Yersinia rohdei ATCC 43380]|nr:hypothetical protein yrohd0001_28340 [Yersinia rohdei ATCC 43380]
MIAVLFLLIYPKYGAYQTVNLVRRNTFTFDSANTRVL